MAQDVKRKREAQEEAKSLSRNEVGSFKFEIENDKKARTKQAKPLNTYCDLFDEKNQKGKRKHPAEKSFISLKPV